MRRCVERSLSRPCTLFNGILLSHFASPDMQYMETLRPSLSATMESKASDSVPDYVAKAGVVSSSCPSRGFMNCS